METQLVIVVIVSDFCGVERGGLAAAGEVEDVVFFVVGLHAASGEEVL